MSSPAPAQCHLLGTTAIVVQATSKSLEYTSMLMSVGVLVILSLVLKRHLERQKRPWRIWIMDVGKQLAGQAVIHGWNVLVSATRYRAENRFLAS